MPGFFKSLAKPRSLSWLWAAAMSAPVIVAAYTEAVPWTVKIACVMVAICCSLWFWLNWPQLGRRFEGLPPFSPEAGQEKASTPKVAQADPVKQPSVAFQLVGNWHQGPFRLTKLREQRALPELYAEDLCLRITAHKNLNKVYLIIKVLCNNALVCELSEFKIFRGEVRKGAQEEILLFRHTFERVPASYTDYVNKRHRLLAGAANDWEILLSFDALELYMPERQPARLRYSYSSAAWRWPRVRLPVDPDRRGSGAAQQGGQCGRCDRNRERYQGREITDGREGRSP